MHIQDLRFSASDLNLVNIQICSEIMIFINKINGFN